MEARGSYEQAEALILEQLEEAPESQMLLKRQVALEKTKGNLSGAIEMLRKYVETFQTDREAWEELGHLYLEVRPAMAPVQSLHAVALRDSCGNPVCNVLHRARLPCVHLWHLAYISHQGCGAHQAEDSVFLCWRLHPY